MLLQDMVVRHVIRTLGLDALHALIKLAVRVGLIGARVMVIVDLALG